MRTPARRALDDRPEHVIAAYLKLSSAIAALEHLRVVPVYDYPSYMARVAPHVEQLKRERDLLWNSVNR